MYIGLDKGDIDLDKLSRELNNMYIRWEDTGFQALEIVAYFYIGDTRYEIVSPSGNPMSQQMQNILKVLKENNTKELSQNKMYYLNPRIT